jgi:hypothetical protein
MNEQLTRYIEEYSGKHGPLLYIRERVKGGTDIVPPMEIANLVELSERITAPEIARGIRSSCKETGVEEYIARVGLKGFGDFNGLVDAFPTDQHLSLTYLNDFWPTGVARILLGKCQNPALKEFARREGVILNEQNLVVSFSPQIGFPHSTITEHPNQPGVTMVDIFRPFPPFEIYEKSQNMSFTDTVNFDGDKIGNRHEFDAKLFQAGLQVRKLIEDAGILDHETSAYQYEGACRGDEPHWLVQIRSFAPRRQADFVLERGDHSFGRSKVMGITPEEGLQLVMLKADKRKEAVDFEKANPNTQYLLNLDWKSTTKKLQLSDQLKNIRGLAVEFKPFLSHQNTRFVQTCLQAPNGFVELNGGSLQYRTIETGALVRVICDGVRRVVERV